MRDSIDVSNCCHKNYETTLFIINLSFNVNLFIFVFRHRTDFIFQRTIQKAHLPPYIIKAISLDVFESSSKKIIIE